MQSCILWKSPRVIGVGAVDIIDAVFVELPNCPVDSGSSGLKYPNPCPDQQTSRPVDQ